MKKLLIFFGLISCTSVNSQTYFEAESLYDSNKRDDAEKVLDTVFKKEIYKNDARFQLKCMNMYADLKRLKKDSVAMQKTYEEMLEIAPQQNADSITLLNIGSEKYEACLRLFAIHMKTNNLQLAEKYLRLTTKYPYYSATGSDVGLERISLRFQYAEFYEKTNKTDSALIQLIPNLESYDLCCEAGALAKVIRIIKANYTKKKIKSMIETIDKEVKKSNWVLFAGLTHVDVEFLVRPPMKRQGMSGTDLWQTSYLYLELKKLTE